MLSNHHHMTKSDNGGRENRDQIPRKDNEEQTQKVLNTQYDVPGQRREQTVKDFPQAAALGQILQDVEFPAQRDDIVFCAENSGRPEADQVISALRKLEERTYHNAAEVTRAVGLLEVKVSDDNSQNENPTNIGRGITERYKAD